MTFFEALSLFIRPFLAIGDNITDILFILSIQSEIFWFSFSLTFFVLPLVLYLFFIVWDPFEIISSRGKSPCLGNKILNLDGGGSIVGRILFLPINTFYETLVAVCSDNKNYERFKFSLFFESIFESLPQAIIQTRIVTSLNLYSTIYFVSFAFSISTLAMDIGTMQRDGNGQPIPILGKLFGFCMTISEIVVFCMLVFPMLYFGNSLFLSIPFIIIFIIERFIRSYFFTKDHLGYGRAMDDWKTEQIFGFIFSLFSHGFINHVERGGTTAKDFESPRHWYMSGLGYLRAFIGGALGLLIFFSSSDFSSSAIFFLILSIVQMVSTYTCLVIFLTGKKYVNK